MNLVVLNKKNSQFHKFVETSIYTCSHQVSNYLNLSDITLHLSVCLFDRTLANAELDEKQLQLTALTCLLLASKVEEDFVPAPSLLLPLLGSSQEEETDSAMKMRMGEMARTERMILKTLNFHLRTSTAATFLHYFTQVCFFPTNVEFKFETPPPSCFHKRLAGWEDLPRLSLTSLFYHPGKNISSKKSLLRRWKSLLVIMTSPSPFYHPGKNMCYVAILIDLFSS